MKEIGHFGVGNSATMTCLHLYPIWSLQRDCMYMSSLVVKIDL